MHASLAQVVLIRIRAVKPAVKSARQGPFQIQTALPATVKRVLIWILVVVRHAHLAITAWGLKKLPVRLHIIMRKQGHRKNLIA